MALAALAHAQALARPEVPEVIKALAGESVVLRAHATGVQVYVCGRGTDGKSEWTLKAPDAELRDDQGALIGHHSAGPSWRHNDGSEVTGKAVARSESADADSRRDRPSDGRSGLPCHRDRKSTRLNSSH